MYLDKWMLQLSWFAIAFFFFLTCFILFSRAARRDGSSDPPQAQPFAVLLQNQGWSSAGLLCCKPGWVSLWLLALCSTALCRAGAAAVSTEDIEVVKKILLFGFFFFLQIFNWLFPITWHGLGGLLKSCSLVC